MIAPLLIHHFPCLDSTSLHARREIIAGRLESARGPVLFGADEQTGGIGRFQRSWQSPAGGLWCTLAIPCANAAPILPAGLGLRIGVACTQFVRELVPHNQRARIRLKWPNDVLLDHQKILGALCEFLTPNPTTSRPGWLLIGVGLNANFQIDQLPPDLHPTATTLLTSLNLTIDLNDAANLLSTKLMATLSTPALPPATLAAARDLLIGIGEQALVSLPSSERVSATFIDIDESGQAIFQRDGARLHLNAGVLQCPEHN